MKKLITLLIVTGLFFTAKLFAQVDSVWWALDDFDTTAVSAVSGDINAWPVTVHGILVIRDFLGGAYAQNKLRISKGDIGWAVDGPEAGPQEENFVQFIVTPKSGFNLHVDSVGAWLAVYGTHLYMHCATYWGVDTNFFSMTNEIMYDSATYGENPGLPDVRDEQNGPLHDTILVVNTDISDGGYFVLRFFPWYNATTTSTSKYFMIWDVRVYGTTSPATDVEDVNSKPKKFALNQNYPNPFNPSTKISFDLEKSGFTKLTVHNILGQKIATILSEEMSAGHHEVDLNATDLTSGIYFYKLESGSFSAVKKMILMQ
jgi:hypothetical protein